MSYIDDCENSESKRRWRRGIVRPIIGLLSTVADMAANGTISAPVAIITPDNHGGLVLITNAFGLVLVLIFLLIRVMARAIISPPFDRDDLALVFATVGQEKSLGCNLLIPC